MRYVQHSASINMARRRNNQVAAAAAAGYFESEPIPSREYYYYLMGLVTVVRVRSYLLIHYRRRPCNSRRLDADICVFLITWHNPPPPFFFWFFTIIISSIYLVTPRFQIMPQSRNNKEIVSHRSPHPLSLRAAASCSFSLFQEWLCMIRQSVGQIYSIETYIEKSHDTTYRIVSCKKRVHQVKKLPVHPSVIQCAQLVGRLLNNAAYTIIRTIIRHFYSAVSWKGFDIVVSCYTLQSCSPSYNNNNHSSSTV